MKKKSWMILGIMLSGSLLAQSVTNAPPAAPLETPPPAPAATNTLPPPPAPATEAAPAATNATTNAPAKPAKKGKKKSGKSGKKSPSKKKEAAELKTVPLVPGPAVVAATHVNVRGQAKLKSEVLTRLNKGDQVTVVEEIVNNNSGPDEPSAWAKILLPSGAHVWANSSFLDPDQKVKPRKLNLRSGPGENFSVIGQLKQGDVVKQVGTKENWVEIEPPTNSYGFMAAQFLKQETAGTMPAPEVAGTEPAPPAAAVTEPPSVATAPTEAPAVPGSSTNAAETSTTATNATTASTAPAAPEEPPKPRIVEREGLVRGMTSIQAPSHFSLVNADNHRLMDYLYTTSHELDLRQYKGLHIIVTGEESLDERWPDTPVLTIQKIQVVD
jgi:uncharacterized protein YgiM (DUF1202 family)